MSRFFILLLVFTAILVSSVFAQEEQNPRITPNNAHLVEQIMLWGSQSELISNIAFHPNGELVVLITITTEGTPSLAQNGSLIFLDVNNLGEVESPIDQVFATSLAFSPDGSLFAIGTETGEITVFDTEVWAKQLYISPTNSQSLALAIDASNEFIASTFGTATYSMESDSGLRLFSTETGEELLKLQCLDFDSLGCAAPLASDIVFDNDGETLYFGTTHSDTALRSWNLATGTETILAENNIASRPRTLVYSEEWLAYFSDTTQITLYGFDTTSATINVLPDNFSDLESNTAMTAHPDKSILVVAYSVRRENNPNRDTIIRFFDTQTLQTIHTIEVNTPELDDNILSLTFSPDGTLLATGGADGTVRLWGIPADE